MPKELISNAEVSDDLEDDYHGDLRLHWGYGHIQLSLSVNGDNVRERASDTEVENYGFFSGSLSVEQIDHLITKLRTAKKSLLKNKGDIDPAHWHRAAEI